VTIISRARLIENIKIISLDPRHLFRTLRSGSKSLYAWVWGISQVEDIDEDVTYEELEDETKQRIRAIVGIDFFF
jgi:hypothetical protein